MNNLENRLHASRVAPLITVISASGGVGKSTIALLIAYLSSQQPISTALVEADLQFGDMGFWLGMDVSLPSLADGSSCVPITISSHLDLFKAPALPEVAEEISDAVAQLVSRIRSEYELVIADTGQFWSGLTAELLCASDLVLLLMDQREASIYGAIKALELCQRLGVPEARVTCVSNRAQNKSRGELARICDALGCDEVYCLGDGRAAVESLISSGRVEELVEGDGAPVYDVRLALSKIFPRIGIEYSASPRKKARRLFT